MLNVGRLGTSKLWITIDFVGTFGKLDYRPTRLGPIDFMYVLKWQWTLYCTM